MTSETTASPLRWFNYLPININWFAITLRSQVLAGLVIPLLVQEFVGEEQKGSYFGAIRLWALMVALLSQALFGLISDRSRFKWGRRRPFIFISVFFDAIIFLGIAWIAGLQGLTGYGLLFAAYIASMIFANMSHAATQGLIPDIVPQEKRGIASGLKMLLEIPLPLVLVGLVIAPMVGQGNLTGALALTFASIAACVVITMFTPEKAPPAERASADWKPFISLVMMTAVFTGIILGLGELVRLSIDALGEASRLALGGIGIAAMITAVVVGIFASLSVHLDKSIRQNKAFIWFIIARLAALTAVFNITSFLLYFLQEKLDFSAGEAVALAGQLSMVLGGFVMLFGLAAGWLADRLSRKLLTIAGALIGALGVVVMVSGETVPMMFVAAGIIGLAYALFNVASWALGTDIIPQERAGEFLGLQNLAGAGAGAIGAYIGGTIADQAGYILMISMFGVMFTLSALATLFIRIEKK